MATNTVQVKSDSARRDAHENIINEDLNDEAVGVDNDVDSDEDQVRKHLKPCNKHEDVPNKGHSPLYDEVVANNIDYASDYTPQCVIYPQKEAAVVTCMDARILPNEIMGLHAGDIHVIRNAGGRTTKDVIRSLVISYKLLKTKQFFVIHHTDCGMLKFTNEVMDDLLEGSLVAADITHNCNQGSCCDPETGCTIKCEPNTVCKWKNTSKCCGKKPCIDYKCINWLTIEHCLAKSVIEDVEKIRNHPLIPSNIPIYGFIFDVKSGLLIPVAKADKKGKATPLFCKHHHHHHHH